MPEEREAHVIVEVPQEEAWTASEIMSGLWLILLPMIIWYVRFSIQRKYKANDEHKAAISKKISELYMRVQHLETEIEKHPDRKEMDSKLVEAKSDLKDLIKARGGNL